MPRIPPKSFGRPKGAKNKIPARSLIFDALVERNFNFFDEYIKLYRDPKTNEIIREKLLMRFAEFLFPKLRPVDLEGKADSSGEHVSELVKVFSEMLSESKRPK